MKAKILVVEDDPPVSMMLQYNLEREGYSVSVAEDGEEALRLIVEDPPDAVVLDWMLPMVSGLEVCRRVRRKLESENVPIIMVTARAEEEDRLRGLDTGADDYVTKPFSPNELVARIRALLRRTRPDLGEKNMGCKGVALSPANREVTFSGQSIQLHPKSFDLLPFLMLHPRRVYSREQLLDHVWGREAAVEPRAVDAQIRRLRRSLDEAGAPNLVRTVRSAGYGLDA